MSFRNSILLVKRLVKCGLAMIAVLLFVDILLPPTKGPNFVTKRIMRNRVLLEKSVETTTDILTTTEVIVTTGQSTKQIEYNSYRSYNYIHVPTRVCKTDGAKLDPTLIIAVKSSVLNIGHREAIRKTWGKFIDPSMKLVFLLGYSSLIKTYINMEYNLYKDLVQQDFIDQYFNNTLKTIMGFDWVVAHCPESKFILFVDDDYFVNLPNIKNYLNTHITKKTKDLIAGYKYVNSIPRRNKNSKWFVSWDEYPNKTWPPYLTGGSMIMDMSIAKSIREQIPYIKPLFIDDVFIGIVAKSLHIELWNERRFSLDYIQSKLDTLFSAHKYGSPHNLILDWNIVLCKHKKLFQSLYNVTNC